MLQSFFSRLLANCIVFFGGLALQTNATTAAESVAFFVNGFENCCADNMTKTRNAFENLGIRVEYSAWNSLEDHNQGSNDFQTSIFIDSATRVLDSLPENANVYLIGHSFGGDSVLQLMQSYKRSKINFRLVAVLDAVGFGGWREVTLSNSIGSNVDYFYNRWQSNAAWPVDITTSGKISCMAQNCDQELRKFSREPNGNTRKTRCAKYEACPGAGMRNSRSGIPYYNPGIKKTRLHHSYVPTDPLIESQLIEIAQNLENSNFGENTNPDTNLDFDTIVYAIDGDGGMYFYKHGGLSDGTADWPIAGSKIGSGWEFEHVFSGENGSIYAIDGDGDMYFYKHGGVNGGTADWPIAGSKIGSGWKFEQVF